MKVFFGQSLWGNRDLGPYGVVENVNWSFQFKNQQYFIPNAYRFFEGITLDIVTILDTNTIKNYINKYKELEGNANEEEYHLIQKENPIPELSINKVYINDELTEVIGQSSGMYIHGIEEYSNADLRDMYGLHPFIQEEASFKLTRIHVRFLKQQQASIEKLMLAPAKTKTLFPIIKHFSINLMFLDNPYQEITFIHPLTNTKHIIAINEVNKFDLGSMHPYFTDSTSIITIGYELIPPMEAGEELLIKDIEVKTTEGHIKINFDEPCPGIGLYSEGKLGLKGYPMKVIATKPMANDIESITMSIIGIDKEETYEDIWVYSANDKA